MHLRLNRFNIRERVREAHCAARDGSGYIKKWNTNRGAAALTLARFASQRGEEFGAGGVVLHVGGIGLGVGENFSGGVDDGGACTSGEGFLRRDFRERVGTVGFDTVREEKRFLSQVALNLSAQRGFPGAANHDVKNSGGGGDNDQENGEELEEDAVLHVLLI